MQIGERIQQLRKAQNFTQKQVAEAVNVQTNSLQQFEYGKLKPSLDTLIKIADFFGVSLDYLAGRADNDNTIKIEKTGSLTQEEKRLLEDYRKLGKINQVRVLERIQMLLEQRTAKTQNKRQGE
ncbi:hypothetical protein AGMMS49975_29720 [Clostridia bacterium]|nr:hypothetical protein AGMMS49975_29720 [Clostridia bacterium]